MLYIGCADAGPLDQCMLLFFGSKSSKRADYHTEMNSKIFSHWCETKVFFQLWPMQPSLSRFLTESNVTLFYMKTVRDQQLHGTKHG